MTSLNILKFFKRHSLWFHLAYLTNCALAIGWLGFVYLTQDKFNEKIAVLGMLSLLSLIGWLYAEKLFDKVLSEDVKQTIRNKIRSMDR